MVAVTGLLMCGGTSDWEVRRRDETGWPQEGKLGDRGM